MTQKTHREFVVDAAVKIACSDIKYKKRGEKAAVVCWRTSLKVSLVTYTDVPFFLILFFSFSKRKLKKLI